MNHTDDQDLQLKQVVSVGDDRYFISTIKMDIRHAWTNPQQNVTVYETMVFAKKEGKVQYHDSLYHKRYATREEALQGHHTIIENIENIVSSCKGCRHKLTL